MALENLSRRAVGQLNVYRSDWERLAVDEGMALAASHVLYNRTEQQSRLLYKCHLNRRAPMITGSPTTCAMMMTRTDTKSKGVCSDRT